MVKKNCFRVKPFIVYQRDSDTTQAKLKYQSKWWTLSLSKEENTKSTKLTITSEIYQDIENDTIQNSLFWIDIKQSFLIECTSEKKSKWKSKSLLVAFPIDLLSDATWVNVYGLVIFSYTYKYIRLYAYIDTRTRRTNQ